ncbi:MAG: hypothetical protein QOF35_2163, partial [Actinomycetota bacterium]|nr:hypothetical protein [Actinomycetota bacterium]
EGDTSSVATRAGWAAYRRLVLAIGFDISGSFFALCCLSAALLGASPILILLLSLLSQAAVVSILVPDVGERSRWGRLLTVAEAPVPRAIVLIVVAIARHQGSGLTWGWVLAVVLLALALVGEGPIKAAWGRVGLEVSGLPTLKAEMPELLRHEVLALLSSVVIVLDVFLAVLGAPYGVALVLSLVLTVIYLDALVRALLRISRVITAEERLRESLVRYAPEFAMYFASTVGAAYQMGMWLPFMLRIGRPFIIVTRNVPMMREIAALARSLGVDVPIIQRPTLRSLEDVIVPSMTTSFYVNNAVRNAHFVERRELTHVWLNHGDSEKPACFNPVHAIYDLLFAAGQAGIDRYARHGVSIPAEKFRIVGRPQVESIEHARGHVGEQQPPTVLYAPTWQGPFADTRVYSLPMGREIVEQLLARGVRVVFRAHPFNYRFPASVDMITGIGRLLATDRAAGGREHLWGAAAEQRLTIEECFNLSDAMVSDVSAVVSDYLRSDKPFAIVSVGRTPESLMKEAPAARAAYVIRQDLSNLSQVYSDLLGPDPLADLRRKTKIYYLGDFGSEHYADGFLQTARQVIDVGRRR